MWRSAGVWSRGADLGSDWMTLAAAVFEAPDPAAKLAEQEVFLSFTVPDPADLATTVVPACWRGHRMATCSRPGLRPGNISSMADTNGLNRNGAMSYCTSMAALNGMS
jgi:NAD(P)-dependent dehydrogenase (short-subunit alcohol dehydrogenase family)